MTDADLPNDNKNKALNLESGRENSNQFDISADLSGLLILDLANKDRRPQGDSRAIGRFYGA